MSDIDKVWDGDLAEKADNGAIFAVTDPAAEQAHRPDRRKKGVFRLKRIEVLICPAVAKAG